MGQKGEDMQYNCAELSLTACGNGARQTFLHDRHERGSARIHGTTSGLELKLCSDPG